MKELIFLGKTIFIDGSEDFQWSDGGGRIFHASCQEDIDSLGYREQEISLDLPSRFKINDEVKFSIIQEFGANPYPFRAFVKSVHFYSGKVKYDLEIPIYNESPTRIYNIDSCFVIEP